MIPESVERARTHALQHGLVLRLSSMSVGEPEIFRDVHQMFSTVATQLGLRLVGEPVSERQPSSNGFQRWVVTWPVMV